VRQCSKASRDREDCGGTGGKHDLFRITVRYVGKELSRAAKLMGATGAGEGAENELSYMVAIEAAEAVIRVVAE
jgi:hypothetical protein